MLLWSYTNITNVLLNYSTFWHFCNKLLLTHVQHDFLKLFTLDIKLLEQIISQIELYYLITFLIRYCCFVCFQVWQTFLLPSSTHSTIRTFFGTHKNCFLDTSATASSWPGCVFLCCCVAASYTSTCVKKSDQKSAAALAMKWLKCHQYFMNEYIFNHMYI